MLAQPGAADVAFVGLGTVPDTDWVRATQSQFDPIRISGRLWIVPSWHVAPDPSAVNLVLDPGMAFGTGLHPRNLHTIPRSSFRRRVAVLRLSRLDEACDRLADALGCGDH